MRTGRPSLASPKSVVLPRTCLCSSHALSSKGTPIGSSLIFYEHPRSTVVFFALPTTYVVFCPSSMINIGRHRLEKVSHPYHSSFPLRSTLSPLLSSSHHGHPASAGEELMADVDRPCETFIFRALVHCTLLPGSGHWRALPACAQASVSMLRWRAAHPRQAASPLASLLLSPYFLLPSFLQCAPNTGSKIAPASFLIRKSPGCSSFFVRLCASAVRRN